MIGYWILDIRTTYKIIHDGIETIPVEFIGKFRSHDLLLIILLGNSAPEICSFITKSSYVNGLMYNISARRWFDNRLAMGFPIYKGGSRNELPN